MRENPARQAIQVLAERGWIKGNYNSPEGVCLVGALPTDDGMTQGYQLCCDVAHEQFPERMNARTALSSFNDHADTTLDDVLLVLEKAAVKLDEQV